MDNFWILNSTRHIKDGKQTLNYWCRLWKEPVEKSQGFRQRSKRIRTVEACGMKLNMYKTWKEDQLVCVTLSRNETKSRGKDFVYYEHNHTLEYLDTIKVNSKVKNTVATEVAKGYRPSDISKNIKGVKWAADKKALEDAGGAHLDLKKIHNAGASWKHQNPDVRIIGARIQWEEQLEESLAMLRALPEESAVKYEIMTVKRKTDGLISHGIVFGKLSRLQILMRRGHLTLMDATHNTNRLHWKLFTVMIRHEYGNWIPGAHMLCEHEDGDIIAAFLATLRRWCGGEGGWQPRYFVTDDSAAEQRAVGLAFNDFRNFKNEARANLFAGASDNFAMASFANPSSSSELLTISNSVHKLATSAIREQVVTFSVDPSRSNLIIDRLQAEHRGANRHHAIENPRVCARLALTRDFSLGNLRHSPRPVAQFTKDKAEARFLALDIELHPRLFEWQEAMTSLVALAPVAQTGQKAVVRILRN
ncbi:hypothetical protein MMC31_003339 [Peltigera leucophlebia]|nr:hypothetical protein [Peltigera leucophlebia]